MFRDDDTEDVGQLYASSHRVRTLLDVWRGDVYYGRAPLLAGALVEQGDQQVSSTLDLRIAGVDPQTGSSWVPVDPFDPLNCYGQRISATYQARRADGSWVSTPLGWFIIDEWELDDDGSVTVSALDLRDVLRTAELLQPLAPRPGGTFVSELRRLVNGRLPIDVTAAPADRAVPSGMSWQESRIDAIYELMTAWPARLDIDPDGVLVVTDDNVDAAPAADVELVEGRGGVVIRRKRAGSRADIANVVVARGDDTSTANAPAVVGYWSDTNTASPTYASGPFGQAVRRFSSPLLRTKAQATKAARTIGVSSLVPARTIPLTLLPDPRLGIGTRVAFTSSSGTVGTTVVSARLPLTGADGPMTIDLAEGDISA